MTKPKCNVQGPCGARDKEGCCVCLKETSNPCSFQKENMRVTNGRIYPYIKHEDKMMDVPVETSSLTMGELFEHYNEARKIVGELLKKRKGALLHE